MFVFKHGPVQARICPDSSWVIFHFSPDLMFEGQVIVLKQIALKLCLGQFILDQLCKMWPIGSLCPSLSPKAFVCRKKSLNVGSFMKKVFKIEFALLVLKVDLHSFSTLLRQKCGISVSKYDATDFFKVQRLPDIFPWIKKKTFWPLLTCRIFWYL